jgi:hypothetical protein
MTTNGHYSRTKIIEAAAVAMEIKGSSHRFPQTPDHVPQLHLDKHLSLHFVDPR